MINLKSVSDLRKMKNTELLNLRNVINKRIFSVKIIVLCIDHVRSLFERGTQASANTVAYRNIISIVSYLVGKINTFSRTRSINRELNAMEKFRFIDFHVKISLILCSVIVYLIQRVYFQIK